MQKIITRFAPSPTGFLHIGGARTALFNWLFAKHFNGKFVLRIEDTDRKRSTNEAVEAIFDGLKWLNIDWDEEPVFQFSRCTRHVEIAEFLVAQGKAYYCYCSKEELEQIKEEAKSNGLYPKYNGKWREKDSKDAPVGVKPVIRLKSEFYGKKELKDIVQGKVVVSNEQLDDMILLRSDGTPTFMLSVVVDDHDMGITHVIRGDDHLTNTFRQMQIFEAMGWNIPQYGHIPLIHGSDGAKLSKRHGALGVDAYKEMGFLPEAICNYLLRLGWSHGDDEIISREQAIEWFNTDNVGKSAARFDLAKLSNLNAHYMRETDNEKLSIKLIEMLNADDLLSDVCKKRLCVGINGLKQRAKNMIELKELSKIYISNYENFQINIEQLMCMKSVYDVLNNIQDWKEDILEDELRKISQILDIKFGIIAQNLRNILTKQRITPSIFEMLVAFGREESLLRINKSINNSN